MISLAQYTKDDINKITQKMNDCKYNIQLLEQKENLTKCEIMVKTSMIRKIFDLKRKLPSRRRKLEYLLNGNGIQKDIREGRNE